jgi:dihydroorotate dehydrogenase
MYEQIIRPLLFRLDAEQAHELVLEWLARAGRVRAAVSVLERMYGRHVPDMPVEVMGIRFPNPLGLAAGLDKDARAIHALSALGFGFLELGTVTPQPQPGNPLPRMFRLPEQEAIINRMGFNSGGIEAFMENISRSNKTVPVGINLGKNAATPIERAAQDYTAGLKHLYLFADYFTINISSPNTKNLRDLQSEQALGALLEEVSRQRQTLTNTFRRRVPIAVKIAPDVDDDSISGIAELLVAHDMDAVIATNTTIDRPDIGNNPLAQETGGLSGNPLQERALAVTRLLFRALDGRLPIIGAGGISTAEDAWQRLLAGADLLQIYSSFIYHGPSILADIVTGLQTKVADTGCSTLQEAIKQSR